MLICEGEWVSNTIWCQLTQNTAQAIGSVITYLRRYSLAAATGQAQQDDDAEGAEGRQSLQPPAPVPAPVKAPASRAKAAKPAAEEPPPAPPAPAPIVLPTPPAEIPPGEAPSYVLKDGAWMHAGFEVAIDKNQQARIKILQKDLGIGDDEWRTKLAGYYGKRSSTDLTRIEAHDCIERLERRKDMRDGV
jgi:hypothetical protein